MSQKTFTTNEPVGHIRSAVERAQVQAHFVKGLSESLNDPHLNNALDGLLEVLADAVKEYVDHVPKCQLCGEATPVDEIAKYNGLCHICGIDMVEQGPYYD